MCVFQKAIVSILLSVWYIEWDFLDVVSVSYYLFLCNHNLQLWLESWNKWAQLVNFARIYYITVRFFGGKIKTKKRSFAITTERQIVVWSHLTTPSNLKQFKKTKNSYSKTKQHLYRKVQRHFYLLLGHVKDTSHSSSSFISHTMCMIIEGRLYKAMQCARVANQLKRVFWGWGLVHIHPGNSVMGKIYEGANWDEPSNLYAFGSGGGRNNYVAASA